jgi:exopolyphosphatase/guanosine-5'-triphosphate,3'-diphosphate pyrophosphatase
MKKFAVIDIGSNSVRLMFVADGKVLYKGLNTTRLGEGIAEQPILRAAAIERSARAVELFYNKAKEEGAQEVFAFATAAVRSAENGAEFTDRVKELCGLSVEVISGEEEAEIGILGALGGADGGVIDIGGASTEIVVKSQGEIIYKKSVNIGVVRLKDKCGRDKELLVEAAKNAATEFGEIPTARMHGIGGTATTLAAQILRLQEYKSEKITGAKITALQMQEMADKLLSMSVEEIAALPCMPKGRADVLTGGAVLLATLMQELGIDELYASDQDNLEGYAIKRGLMN